MVTVKELIKYLQEQPQDRLVAFRCCSEQCLLELQDIEEEELCIAREDGWIQNRRPDKPTQYYLVFPGN